MNQLLKMALLGTGKCREEPTLVTSPVAHLDFISEGISRESRLLLQAGSLAVYQAAGKPLTLVPPLPEAPADQESRASPTLLKILERTLTPEETELLPEFLVALSARGLSVPHSLLPRFLSLTDPELRRELLPVLGKRGVWLSQFDPNWAWCREKSDSEEETIDALSGPWLEGSVTQRVEVLGQVRRLNPGLGLTWLEEVFSKEKAGTRRAFLEQLRVGLAATDEPFLNQSLSDRSQQVRFLAADLLMQLPDSEVARRMQQRGEALLRNVAAIGGEIHLKCEPPQQIPKEWLEDGIPEKSSHGEGPRGFWTEEIVARIPLGFWTKLFERIPLALVNGILNDHFSHSVISGWTRAFDRDRLLMDSQNALWGEPLWKYWFAMLQHPQQSVKDQACQKLRRLALQFDPGELDRWLLQLLQEQPDPANLPIVEILNWRTGNWSIAFSKEYLRITKGLVAARSDRAVSDWLQSLPIAAIHIPCELIESASANWKIRDYGVQSGQIAAIEKQVTSFLERLRLRSLFHQELNVLVELNNP